MLIAILVLFLSTPALAATADTGDTGVAYTTYYRGSGCFSGSGCNAAGGPSSPGLALFLAILANRRRRS